MWGQRGKDGDSVCGKCEEREARVCGSVRRGRGRGRV